MPKGLIVGEKLPEELKEVTDLLEVLAKKVAALDMKEHPYFKLLRTVSYGCNEIDDKYLSKYGLTLYEAVNDFIKYRHYVAGLLVNPKEVPE